MSDYIAPKFNLDAFTCPHCDAITQQSWAKLIVNTQEHRSSGFMIAHCLRPSCSKPSIWKLSNGTMIYPLMSDAPLCNEDMPEEIQRDYNEAHSILAYSPRGAAALLRLCIQKLSKELGHKGKNINDNIRQMVKDGLDSKVQKMLDYVRVIGNDAVHPGQIDLNDNPEIAHTLFYLVNEIVEELISKPKHLDEIYNELPESARAAIDRQDGRVAATASTPQPGAGSAQNPA